MGIKKSNSSLALVSVVIPTYNQEKYISDCLGSVLSQSYNNLEVIVADDCSTDGTLQIIKQLAQKDNRIVVLESSVNLGIPKNFNRAFDACTGEFVAFLGGDDLMYPNKIASQVQFLECKPEYSVVIHILHYINENSEIIGERRYKVKSDYNPKEWVFPNHWSQLNLSDSVTPSSMLARSSYFLKNRYPTDYIYKHEILHHFLNYQDAPNEKWGKINDFLGAYRIHSNNYSSNNQNKKYILEESIKLYQTIYNQFPIYRSEAINSLQSFLFNCIIKDFYPDEKEDITSLFYKNSSPHQVIYLQFFLVLKNLKLDKLYLVLIGLIRKFILKYYYG